MRQLGFTIIELLIVLTLLLIIAVLTTYAIRSFNQDAREAAALNIVQMVQRKISEYHAKTSSWPDNIMAEWFSSAQLPVNPLHPDHNRDITDDVDGENNPNKWHPRDKTTRTWPFWYNASNGAFRIRVPRQANNTETLSLYNRVNGTDASSLNDISM